MEEAACPVWKTCAYRPDWRPVSTRPRAGANCARCSPVSGPLVLPGVSDALGARLVDAAGFPAAYATGAGIANAQFGLADIGLVSLGEMVEQVGRIADATALPSSSTATPATAAR